MAATTVPSAESKPSDISQGLSTPLPARLCCAPVSANTSTIELSLTPRRPDNYNFAADSLGDEDCLFVSVFAPADASDLPVLLWIRKLFSVPPHLPEGKRLTRAQTGADMEPDRGTTTCLR
jgi:hypothetical protein